MKALYYIALFLGGALGFSTGKPHLSQIKSMHLVSKMAHSPKTEYIEYYSYDSSGECISAISYAHKSDASKQPNTLPHLPFTKFIMQHSDTSEEWQTNFSINPKEEAIVENDTLFYLPRVKQKLRSDGYVLKDAYGLHYTYDSLGHRIKQEGRGTAFHLTWSRGDCIQSVRIDTLNNKYLYTYSWFTYYPDSNTLDFGIKRYGKENLHLVKSRTDSSTEPAIRTTSYFTYERDSKERIIKERQKTEGGGTIIRTYTYFD